MSFRTTVGALLATAALSTAAVAQTVTPMGTGKGGSPHEKITWKVGGANIEIEYGRPFLKGRPEAQMMPAGQPWRTGADAATILKTDKPLTFGTVTIAPGTYTINTEPGDKEWKLILGKLNAPGQWGVPYLPNLEIGRAPMKVSKNAKSVEQVTISIDAASPTLKVEWGTVAASVPFKVGS
jgi:hypothetical protein